MAQSKNGRNAKSPKAKRKPDGQVEQLLRPASTPPSEALPKWLRPSPGMDTHAYAEAFGLAIHLDSLNRSLKGDSAAHAKWREQALKGLGLGQRQELDITARQDQAWMQQLTDAELLTLKAIRDMAIARTSGLKSLSLADQESPS